MTAQLVEVEHALRRSMREQPQLWRGTPDPIEVLRQGAQRYAELEPRLTTPNRRRYQRLAARLVDERKANRGGDSAAIFRRMRIDAYRDKYAVAKKR